MQRKAIVFIGRSGSGKGTQAKRICDYIKQHDQNQNEVFYLETGSHFREFIKGDSYTSRRSAEIYNKAERQPDFLAIWNWADIVVNKLSDDMHLIMDGMPRSLNEAEMLRTAFDFYGMEKPVVVYLHVSDVWAREKLIFRHRDDDKGAEQIEKKIAWFNQDVLPAVEYFKKDPYYHFIEIDGEKSIEEVYKNIIDSISW